MKKECTATIWYMMEASDSIMENQQTYWDSVANDKTFTHPLNIEVLRGFIASDAYIMDYGCGYGRLVEELSNAGFANVKGFDTSIGLINRGTANTIENLFYINHPSNLPLEDNSVDCILLFAVLTCIPSNQAQTELINILYAKLKPGGIIYISDYYLQSESSEVDRYGFLNEDRDNFGVFTLAEGVTFRHHTKAWIASLLKDFTIENETLIDVKTMNGNRGEAFQLIARKTAV